MPVIRIKVKDFEQLFLKSGSFLPGKNYLDASGYPILKDYIPSLVIAIPERQAILKLVRARRAIEYVKMLWNRSRVSKEIEGNRLLNRIGISVPAILEIGLGLFPVKGYQFLGYYIMEDVRSSGYENSRFLFLENRIGLEQRQHFLANVIRDVMNMRSHRVVFNDFKFENIFCNEQGETLWIDTGVSYYPRWQHRKFLKKHNDAVDYFLHHHEKFLIPEEVMQFKALYFGEAG